MSDPFLWPAANAFSVPAPSLPFFFARYFLSCRKRREKSPADLLFIESCSTRANQYNKLYSVILDLE